MEDAKIAYTETTIVSLAAMLLGHKPIQSLDNQDDLITALDQAYQILLPAVLSTGNWRFATTITQLSLSVEVPPPQTNWQNIYLLPSGYLKNLRIIPQNYVYEIYSNSQIWCNWGTVGPFYMEYAYQPLVQQLPPLFIHYFIYELACFCALASAQKPEYFNALEAKRVQMQAIAAAADAQNRPSFNQAVIPVIDKRQVTGIIGPQIG